MKSACLFLAILISSAVVLPAASISEKPQSVSHSHAKHHKAKKHQALKQA